MLVDPEAFKNKALACFTPPLSRNDEETTWEELKHLSMIYKRNRVADRQREPLVAVNYWVQWSDGRVENIIIPGPRRRGRPMDQAEKRLVCDLRNLLIKLERNHGATHQDRTHYHSGLEDLAKVVHAMVGEPPQGGWRDKAEMANASMEKSSRRRVWRWWFSLEHGYGAHPRSSTLEEDRFWEAVCSVTLASD